MYIRSILEQSCQVWHHSLTEENKNDLERIQKSALKIIFNGSKLDYEEALKLLNLQNLHSRREILCEKFAQNCIQFEKTKSMFPINNNKLNTRRKECFAVKFARTTRLKSSAIPQMQRMLNQI